MSDADRRGARRYPRGEVEFGRIVGFSDGIFGIAMTLLVAGIAVPEVARDDLGRALADNVDDVFSFGLSFAVIGFLWLGHHGFFRLLTHMDDRLMRINLAYLGLIAFMPFPTALLGRYDGDVIAVGLYAVVLAVASVTEALMFRHARRIGALRKPIPDDVYRHYMRANLAPAVVFLASIPVALAYPAVSMLMWIAIFPLERWLARFGGPAVAQWERDAVGASE
jgi:uncharacterized membrane protein